MKKAIILAACAVCAVAVGICGDLTPQVIPSLMKARLAAEAQRAPNLGKDWREHAMSAAEIYSVTGQVYTGSAKTPTPTVKLNKKTLTAGTDFDFTYTNNVNAGLASLTITAKKFDYYGSQTVKFQIAPASLSGCTISNIANQVATGSPVKPIPIVVLDGTALVYGTDFETAYLRNTGTGTNALCIVNGIGNYGGTASKQFAIVSE